MKLKSIFLNLHLILSLIAGIVITISCFTGALLTFEDELTEAFHPERYKVAQITANRLPLQQLQASFKQLQPKEKIKRIKVYTDPQRTVEISYGKDKKSKTAFIDPYTAKVIALYDYKETFFSTVLDLHRTLLAGKTGKFITGLSASIFLFIIITGIILWWPKNWVILKQRLQFKRNASWKRFNHDAHVVVGFYASIILFTCAFTGLAWSYKWMNDGIYKVTGTTSKMPDPPLSTYQPEIKPLSFDAALTNIQKQVTNAMYFEISKPKDSTASITVATLSKAAFHDRAIDSYYMDQYTGAKIGELKFNDRNLGQRVRRTFFPIHTGTIFGWPSRILAFLACFAGVTFPITGTIMWINKLKKRKQQRQKQALQAA